MTLFVGDGIERGQQIARSLRNTWIAIARKAFDRIYRDDGGVDSGEVGERADRSVAIIGAQASSKIEYELQRAPAGE